MPEITPRFGSPIGPWREWFAWRPVRLFDDTLVWWRWIARRRIQKHEHLTGGEPLAQWWQYADVDYFVTQETNRLRRTGGAA